MRVYYPVDFDEYGKTIRMLIQEPNGTVYYHSFSSMTGTGLAHPDYGRMMVF
jgi:hypothetical protein